MNAPVQNSWPTTPGPDRASRQWYCRPENALLRPFAVSVTRVPYVLRRSSADLFGLDPDEAAAHVADGRVTSEEVVAYLLGAVVPRRPAGPDAGGDGAPPRGDRTGVAGPAVAPRTLGRRVPRVPRRHPRRVSRRRGRPGVDGDEVPAFRRGFGVDAAPAFCLFRDGELAEAYTGRGRPARLAERFEAVYGDADRK